MDREPFQTAEWVSERWKKKKGLRGRGRRRVEWNDGCSTMPDIGIRRGQICPSNTGKCVRCAVCLIWSGSLCVICQSQGHFLAFRFSICQEFHLRWRWRHQLGNLGVSSWPRRFASRCSEVSSKSFRLNEIEPTLEGLYLISREKLRDLDHLVDRVGRCVDVALYSRWFPIRRKVLGWTGSFRQ